MDTSERGLWGETFHVLYKNMMPAIVYCAFMLVISFADEMLNLSSGLAVAEAMAAALLALPAHLTVLMGVSGLNALGDVEVSRRFLPFTWRALALGLVAFIPFAVVVVIAATADDPLTIPMLLGLLVTLAISAAVFAKWGTILPAVAMGHDTSLKLASQRGSRSFGFAFPRLLVALGLLTLLQMAITIATAMTTDDGGSFFTNTGGIDMTSTLSAVLLAFITALQIVMTAVILSNAYQMSEAAAPTPEDPEPVL